MLEPFWFLMRQKVRVVKEHWKQELEYIIIICVGQQTFAFPLQKNLYQRGQVIM